VSVCLSLSLSLCLSLSVSLSLSFSFSLFLFLSLSLSLCVSVSLSLSLCVSLSFSIYLFVFRSLCFFFSLTNSRQDLQLQETLISLNIVDGFVGEKPLEIPAGQQTCQLSHCLSSRTGVFQSAAAIRDPTAGLAHVDNIVADNEK
jgi:hypothetical protein